MVSDVKWFVELNSPQWREGEKSRNGGVRRESKCARECKSPKGGKRKITLSDTRGDAFIRLKMGLISLSATEIPIFDMG